MQDAAGLAGEFGAMPVQPITMTRTPSAC